MNETQDCQAVAEVLGVDPLYVVSLTGGMIPLSELERNYLLLNKRSGCIAFTAPANDLAFKSHLQYEWRGRGCCITFCESPLNMTREQRIGVAIHEIAHYFDAFDNPARDDTDHGRALKASWANMKPESEQHSRRWLRSLVHAHHRVEQAGIACDFAKVVTLQQYGFTLRDCLPFVVEAEAREGEPIEAILRSPFPGRKPKSVVATCPQQKGKSRDQAGTPRKRRRQTSGPIPDCLYVNRDGTCTYNGQRYASEAAWRAAQQAEKSAKAVEAEARERAAALQVEHRANELAGVTVPAATTTRPKPTRAQILQAVRAALSY